MSEEKTKESRPLIDIFMDIAGVENGLAYNEIAWNYTPDKLEMAMGMSHPADILDDIFGEIGNRLYFDKNADVTKKELTDMNKQLKAFSKAFSIKELKKPIQDITEYIKNMQ